jgi:hypothetical protein
MKFFREMSPTEAQLLKKRVHIDNDLHHYITRMLYAVGNGKEVPVPADFPMQEKPLKVAIKKVSRGLSIPVRFDKSVQGGFIVRKATVDEETAGENLGQKLGRARRKK